MTRESANDSFRLTWRHQPHNVMTRASTRQPTYISCKRLQSHNESTTQRFDFFGPTECSHTQLRDAAMRGITASTWHLSVDHRWNRTRLPFLQETDRQKTDRRRIGDGSETDRPNVLVRALVARDLGQARQKKQAILYGTKVTHKELVQVCVQKECVSVVCIHYFGKGGRGKAHMRNMTEAKAKCVWGCT